LPAATGGTGRTAHPTHPVPPGRARFGRGHTITRFNHFRPGGRAGRRPGAVALLTTVASRPPAICSRYLTNRLSPSTPQWSSARRRHGPGASPTECVSGARTESSWKVHAAEYRPRLLRCPAVWARLGECQRGPQASSLRARQAPPSQPVRLVGPGGITTSMLVGTHPTYVLDGRLPPEQTCCVRVQRAVKSRLQCTMLLHSPPKAQRPGREK
jgi:hypothetical protein